jgi:cellulose biosynthesis protein BcsQ
MSTMTSILATSLAKAGYKALVIDTDSSNSLKKLKKALNGLDYDYCIIATSPTYDNIIGNVLSE